VNVVRRRRWTIAKQFPVVEESFLPGMSVSFATRKYDIAPNQICRWRKLMSGGGKAAIQAGDHVVIAAEAKALKKRIRDLKRLLGWKTMKAEILKEAIHGPREKLIPRPPLPFKDGSL
jgi:transposase